MTSQPPPGSPGGLADVGRTIVRAVVGGTNAFTGTIAVGQVLAGVGSLLVGGYGLWSWVKAGLLTVLLALRADVVATVRGVPILSNADLPASVHVRFVPMVLTIAFLALSARAGRRAARGWSGSSPLVASGLAAAGAAVPAALLGAICASVVTLSFPIFVDLRLHVDIASAALWAALLAAVGAGTGAYFERASRGRLTSVFRGGLIAYGWALALLAFGVLVVATFEPTVTRRYVDGLTGLGAGGGVLFGYHLLAIPAQSALLLAPASGSCVEIIGEGSILELCPWRLAGSGPIGSLFVPEPLALSPLLWMLSGVPLTAAILGGWRAGAGLRIGRRAIGVGAASGLVFASLAILGSWLVAPQFHTLARLVSVHPMWIRTAYAALIWGVIGGAVGGWLAGRTYDEPGLPSPTSA